MDVTEEDIGQEVGSMMTVVNKRTTIYFAMEKNLSRAREVSCCKLKMSDDVACCVKITFFGLYSSCM
jgi:hypothetical protein